ncbi:MAG: response regulator transcription factor [Anaerolineaceae bacterium]|nr:MAG: response regulator transcription factor [Anaerolineaceae bacterium]
MCPARLYIVDEHDSVRSALADRLSRATGFTVLGHSGDANQVLEDIQAQEPDVVLLEVKRSDGMGLEIMRQISELSDPPCLVVLTSYPTEWEEEAAIRAGATSYLLKDLDTEELIRYISELCSK